MEDCISQEPQHLLGPTIEDIRLEQEYESDPEPMFNLENIAKGEAFLAQRTETMGQPDEDKELHRTTTTTKPIQRMEHLQLQKKCSRRGM